MISFSNPLVLLLLLPLVAGTVAIWRNGYVNLSPRRQRVALAVRVALLTAIVLGLAGMGLSLPQSRQAVVFIADLSASDQGSKSTMRSLINAAVMHRPSGDLAGVISVGRQALVEQPVAPLSSFDSFQTTVDHDYTNLEGGLETANAILPDGYRRRIVMMTDGQQNVGDALATARLLHSLGVRIDVLPMSESGGPEVLVDSVDVPSQLRPQERFTLSVSVQSTVETTSGLDVYRDHTLLLSRQVRVHVGANHYTFDQAPLRPGFHGYRVVITPASDTQFANNTGSAFTTVQGPPTVLVIAQHLGEAANVMASLRSTGIHATLQTPLQVIPTLGYLQRFASVVIVDTAADELGPDILAQLVPYVRDLGHGLVLIGGRESYGMGGYGQTALEEALPVKMDLPKRKDLPSAAVVLIIENLEAQTQVNISKQAGKGVVNLLTQQDQVGINDALGSGGFAVRLQSAANKHAIDSAIDQMQPGDPMSYASDLQAAYDALQHAHARVKHIILLGDGDAEDPAYEQMVKRIRAGGVTVSTIATNGLGFNDFSNMQNIARWGGGRYYRGDDTSAIPNIFLREARTVARSGIVTGKFFPQQLSANPMLRDVRGVPPLYGYVATTPKPTGEMVLVSKKLDPVLAGWQFGLGRSVAWTSDAAGLWSRDWLQAPGANRFWANLVSWTLPAIQGGKLFVATTSSQGQGQISVDTPPSLGANPDVTARILDPNLHPTTIQLQPSAPGHYSGSFLAHAQGAYFVTVDAHGQGHAEAGQAGVDVPYSAEYRSTGTSMAFLHSLAAAGGGSIITQPRSAWLDNLSAVFANQSLANWLWLLAILLLPVDIAARRLIVSREDLIAIRDAIVLRRTGVRPLEPAVAPLGAVRSRRARVHAPSRPAATPASGAVFLKSTPVPTAPEGTRGGTPAATPQPAPAPPMPDTAAPSGESTAERLLAAKRRRK